MLSAQWKCLKPDEGCSQQNLRFLRYPSFLPFITVKPVNCETGSMKRYSTVLLFGLLSLTSQLAHADLVDDAIGNIQQAINDAYNPSSASRRDEDDDRYEDRRRNDSRQYDDRRRQLEDRRRQLDDRQRQLDQDRRQLEDDERRLEDNYDG